MQHMESGLSDFKSDNSDSTVLILIMSAVISSKMPPTACGFYWSYKQLERIAQ